jgi:hypothetical protein
MAGKAVAPQPILTYVGFDSFFDKSLQMKEKAFPRKHFRESTIIKDSSLLHTGWR